MQRFEHIYIHLPFCDVICHYCDFYTVRAKEARHEELFTALRQELALYKKQLAPELKAVYFGGGTPGVTPPALLHAFLDELRPHIIPTTEVTLEANPHNATKENVRAWRQAGFNRVSIGIQSLRDDLLRKLGRTHTGKFALNALENCLVEFENVTGDLMYAVPEQALQEPAEDALTLAKTGIKHLSAYHLTLSPEHFLFRKLPSHDDALVQVQAISEALATKDFGHYEISNFGRPGFESRNNTNYWLGGAYLALGPSAHGYDGENRRWHNAANWELYCKSLAEGRLAIAEEEHLSLEQRKTEYLFTRLRLQSGINLKEFSALFGYALEERNAVLFSELEKNDFGTLRNGSFIPSFKGRMLGDEISAKIR